MGNNTLRNWLNWSFCLLKLYILTAILQNMLAFELAFAVLDLHSLICSNPLLFCNEVVV